MWRLIVKYSKSFRKIERKKNANKALEKYKCDLSFYIHII